MDSVFSLRMAETMCSIPHQMRRRSLASPPRDSPPRPRRSSLTLPSDGPVLRSGMRIIEDDPSVARKPTTSLSTVARKTLSYRSMCSDNLADGKFKPRRRSMPLDLSLTPPTCAVSDETASTSSYSLSMHEMNHRKPRLDQSF